MVLKDPVDAVFGGATIAPPLLWVMLTSITDSGKAIAGHHNMEELNGYNKGPCDSRRVANPMNGSMEPST